MSSDVSECGRRRRCAALVAAIGGATLCAVPAARAENGRKVTAGYYVGGHKVETASAWYKDNGDGRGHVYLCDHATDHHSVAVELVYTDVDRPKRKQDVWYWYTGGPDKYNGCKDIPVSVSVAHPNGGEIGYRVCLGDYDKSHAAKGRVGGKQPNLMSTCSQPAVARVKG